MKATQEELIAMGQISMDEAQIICEDYMVQSMSSAQVIVSMKQILFLLIMDHEEKIIDIVKQTLPSK